MLLKKIPDNFRDIMDFICYSEGLSSQTFHLLYLISGILRSVILRVYCTVHVEALLEGIPIHEYNIRNVCLVTIISRINRG